LIRKNPIRDGRKLKNRRELRGVKSLSRWGRNARRKEGSRKAKQAERTGGLP